MFSVIFALFLMLTLSTPAPVYVVEVQAQPEPVAITAEQAEPEPEAIADPVAAPEPAQPAPVAVEAEPAPVAPEPVATQAEPAPAQYVPSIDDTPPEGFAYEFTRNESGGWDYVRTIPVDELQPPTLEPGNEWCDSCGEQWPVDDLLECTYGETGEYHGPICPDCVEFWLDGKICTWHTH